MMDYLYPKIFTLATKEQMVAALSGMESLGIKLNIGEVKINQVESLHKLDDISFGIADYDIEIRMELLNQTVRAPEVIESLEDSFKQSYGATNMSYNESTTTLSFDGHKYVMCIKDPSYEDEWYFLEYDPTNTMAFEMLIDNEVLTKFIERTKN